MFCVSVLLETNDRISSDLLQASRYEAGIVPMPGW